MSTVARSVLFRVAAMLLPLIVLAIIEVALRAAGVAEDERRPFLPVENHEDYLVLNRGYTARYFGTFSPGAAYNPFHAKKRDDTFRVFAFGGSTTAGFPNDTYAFPAIVQSRLESFLPALRNEVVNLALTATNSYTIWDLSRDVVALEPDAVIIYAGHNEYYGAFGAGTSVNRLGNVRWLKRLVLRLKRTVLYTLLEQVFYAVRPARDVVGRTMMAEAVGDASIPLGGTEFHEGMVQFEENLSAAVRRFCGAGIPVYLGTLVSNLSGQPPLGEDTTAAAAYAAGLRSLQEGRYEDARARFVDARDRDDLRFRAPSVANEVIGRVATGTCAETVDMGEAFRSASPDGIEGAALFVDHLHPGVAGHRLMADTFFRALLDHPRLSGRPRMDVAPVVTDVDAFEAAAAELRIGRLKLGHPFLKGYTPEEEAERVRAYVGRFVARSPLDSLVARTEFGDVAEVTALGEAVNRARAGADTLGALRMYWSLSRKRPFDADAAREAILLGAGRADAAPLVRDIARMWVNRTSDPFFADALTFALLTIGRAADAARLLALSEALHVARPAEQYNRIRWLVSQGNRPEAALRLEKLASALSVSTDLSRWQSDLPFERLLGLEIDDFRSLVWLGDNHRRAGRLREAVSAYDSAREQRPKDLALQNNVATAFLQLGDTTEAVDRYRAILRTDSTFVEAWLNLALYYARTGQARQANEAMRRAVALAPDHPMIRRLRGDRGR